MPLSLDLGGDIIMGIDDVDRVCPLSGAAVVANQLEAISHSPGSRVALAAATASAKVDLLMPQDGEVLTLCPRLTVRCAIQRRYCRVRNISATCCTSSAHSGETPGWLSRPRLSLRS